MNSRSAESHRIRSRPVTAIALLIAFMAIALAMWLLLPHPTSRMVPWIPILASLLAARQSGPGVLSLRSIAYAGSAFLICQAAIQVALATGVIAI